MSEKEFLVEAVAQFLQSNRWLEAISAFFEANYWKFISNESREEKRQQQDKVTGYSLEQYDTFLLFKDLVERMLEGVIVDLGCTGEDLMEVLADSTITANVSGERRAFIKLLLAFEDYDAFYTKISEYAAEKQVNGYPSEESVNGYPNEGPANGISEWELQEAIARSILEAKELGQLDESEESLATWAEALIELNQRSAEVVDSNERSTDVDATEPCSEQDARLKELEEVLIRERLKVDLLVAQRIADANTQLKSQMLHLVAEEVGKDQYQEEDYLKASEDELAALIAQAETIRNRLQEIKKQCFEFKNVGREELDKVYLYLKEKVHFQQDLVSQEKEISDYIFTQIQQSDAPLIPLMLEWVLLESEALRVQYQIQERVNDSNDDGYWTQIWDSDSQAYYYMHSITGESVWDPPPNGYYDANQDFQIPSWNTSEMTVDTTANDAENSSQYSGMNYGEEAYEELSQGQDLTQAATVLESALELSSEAKSNKLLEMESVLERISREHDEERKRLELLFQLEKARQKEELRKRKELRRREKATRKKKHADKEHKDVEDTDVALTDNKAFDTANTMAKPAPPPPITARSLLVAPRLAESKSDGGSLSIVVPGHGRIDLTHLLSEAHAKRRHELKGTTATSLQSPLQTLLNPTSLRYLTEQMVRKQPTAWGGNAGIKEIVLDEMEQNASDEK